MALVQGLSNIISKRPLPEITKWHIVAIIIIIIIISTAGSLKVTDTVPEPMQPADSENQCTKVVIEENCCGNEYAAINKDFASIYDAAKWPGNKFSDITSALTSIGVRTSCSCKAPEYKEVATVEDGRCILEEVKISRHS